MSFPPIFASDAEATRTYVACGKAAIKWGPIELAIESLLIKLRQLQPNAAKKERFPLQFGRKIAHLRDLMKLDPEYEPIQAVIEPLLENAQRLHAIRTDIVHSLCQGTSIYGEIIFGKSDHRRKDRPVSYTETRYTINDIENAGDAMDQLQVALISQFIALRLLESSNIPEC